MKFLLISSLFLTTTAFAQTLDINGFKKILTERQTNLERINQGMSKKLVSLTKIPTELGFCEFTETAIQTILKIEAGKIIVHSKESYIPGQTPSCAGFESQEVSVLFYEDKPTLAADLADLDASAETITSIVKAGEIVTLNLTVENKPIVVKYDLTKPTFKNVIFSQAGNQTTNGSDMSDVDVNTIDLKKVLFCDSSDSDSCVEGDFSDILF